MQKPLFIETSFLSGLLCSSLLGNKTTMTNTHTSTTAMYHRQDLIEVVAYSFSPCEQTIKSFTANKVYLDILFVHPRTSEAISLRTTTPAHLLYQSKEAIEHAVYREIRSALSFAPAGSM